MAFLFCNILRIDIDSNFIAVVLTILGYSLNDTVVIYDRIRENKKLFSQLSTRELTNKSINETLGRSITTAFATFLAILTVGVVCEIAGLTSLRSFVIPMLIGGILSGSYSSICIAGPLWVLWSEYSEKRRAKKSFKKKLTSLGSSTAFAVGNCIRKARSSARKNAFQAFLCSTCGSLGTLCGWEPFASHRCANETEASTIP